MPVELLLLAFLMGDKQHQNKKADNNGVKGKNVDKAF